MSRNIQFTAAACVVAKAIWYARATAYGLADTPWESLAPTTKHLYVQQAEDILDANRPAENVSLRRTNTDLFDAVAGMVRRDAAKVIGVIDETRPWGERR